MSEVIKNRYDFMILFDVENGNPNGDPDAGNFPRIDPETGLGIVTDVCLKRKIRDYVSTVKDGEAGYRLYISKDGSLNDKDKEATNYLGLDDIKDAKKNDPDVDLKIRRFMCDNFFDIRTFGAVMTTFTKNGLNCGQVRGPVQMSFGKSVEPIVPQELTITRVAITRNEDIENKNKSTEMGRKYAVPYALYVAKGYISANLAKKVTGFNEDDLNLLWEAIMNMFEHDHSAARGNMAVRELIIFKHDNEMGRVQAYKLFDRVHIVKGEPNTVARSFSDYKIEVDLSDLPDGVTCERRV